MEVGPKKASSRLSKLVGDLHSASETSRVLEPPIPGQQQGDNGGVEGAALYSDEEEEEDIVIDTSEDEEEL